MLKEHLLICLTISLAIAANGQSFLSPAPAQAAPILISGVTAHIGNGEVIEDATLALANGRITFVGKAADFTGDKTNQINAAGKHAYPGFIATNTVLGLREIAAVRATNDQDEVGKYNAHTRSIIAYNTDSRVTPTVRSNGILMAQVAPQGGRISGRSSLVQLDAWNWEDAAYATDEGLHLRWPGMYTYKGWWAEPGSVVMNENYAKEAQELKTYFNLAKAYAATSKDATVRNLGFEAMRTLFSSNMRLYIHAQNAMEIRDAILWAESMTMKPVIVGARDAWQLTDFLNKHPADILLMQPQSLPHLEHSDIDQPYRTAAALHEAGIAFGLGTNGFWQQRNLPFQIGQAIAYGLPYEAAVQSVTLQIARMMGVADRCGSLEVGKEATLFISEGDVFDMRTSQVTHAFIQGRTIDLNNKQKMLSEKYREKYDR